MHDPEFFFKWNQGMYTIDKTTEALPCSANGVPCDISTRTTEEDVANRRENQDQRALGGWDRCKHTNVCVWADKRIETVDTSAISISELLDSSNLFPMPHYSDWL